jgi:hypothetical protein
VYTDPRNVALKEKVLQESWALSGHAQNYTKQHRPRYLFFVGHRTAPKAGFSPFVLSAFLVEKVRLRAEQALICFAQHARGGSHEIGVWFN